VAQPGTASALRADFRKDIPVQIWASAFLIFGDIDGLIPQRKIRLSQ